MRHFVNEQGEIVHQANRKNICRFNLLKACRITAKKVTVMCRRQYIVDHDFFEFRVLRCRQNSVVSNKITTSSSKMHYRTLVLQVIKVRPQKRSG
ncbi:hypothetical protein [Escherichia phage Stx2 II]|uniref:Uncharacterized protein n=3 Tax=Traversvirus TaxID=1981157 RepID=G3CFM9_9CAUD|nr:hypothetical protein Stx2II_p009 [Escherichia phage Stx2 II]YP_009168156.1 hypothetical protein APL45_gp68 [Escherichia phage vB_EcoP_24B]ADN68451.1 hypothetical protein vb_24B_30c [Escherichia phage vB_EcoP_24B]BAB87857.1 hypothetical protein [Stx2 converting phage I]BAC77991.1 hypothetical protein [Escherichia phage Stx2 II]